MTKRFYAIEVDGRKAVLNMRTLTVHFDVAAASDITSPEDTKLVPGQKNIWVGPCPYQHAEPEKPLNPVEQMKRSERLVEGFRFPSVELTVGDLSIAAEDKRKHRGRDGKRFLRNVEEGLSVGDLTDKEDDNKKGLDGLFVGRPIFEPAMTESAQIDGQRVARRQKEIDQAVRVRNMLLGGRDEALERYLDKYVRGKHEKEPK